MPNTYHVCHIFLWFNLLRAALQLSDPVAEIRSNLHVQILPGLLDYSENKSHSPEWIGKRDRKSKSQLPIKHFSYSEQGTFIPGTPRERAELFSQLFAMNLDHFCNISLRNWSFLCPLSDSQSKHQVGEMQDPDRTEDWKGKCFCLRKLCPSAPLLKFIPHCWWGLSWILAQGSFPVR